MEPSARTNITGLIMMLITVAGGLNYIGKGPQRPGWLMVIAGGIGIIVFSWRWMKTRKRYERGDR